MSLFSTGIEAELPQMRADAEALMQDRCIVRYPTGHMAQDEDTGSETPELAERFRSPCKVQVGGLSLGISANRAGGNIQTVARGEVHFPAEIATPNVGDVITITEIGANTLPAMQGRRFRVTGFNTKSWATALRVEVEDVL